VLDEWVELRAGVSGADRADDEIVVAAAVLGVPLAAEPNDGVVEDRPVRRQMMRHVGELGGIGLAGAMCEARGDVSLAGREH
jgi:hypothetical protein